MIHLYRSIVITAVLLAVVSLGHIGQAASPAATPTTREVWRLGITSEGDATNAALIGRPASIAAAFRSHRGVQDIYFAFPGSARAQTIQSAAYRLLQRSGTYTSTATLTLEVRNAGGIVRRTVSAAPVNLQTATLDTWATLALSPNAANLVIAPGEHLVVHFALGGAPAGTLDVRPVFEVTVTNDPGSTGRMINLPLIVR